MNMLIVDDESMMLDIEMPGKTDYFCPRPCEGIVCLSGVSARCGSK